VHLLYILSWLVLLSLWGTWYLDFGDGIYHVALHHIALHCIAWHLELCREPMVAAIPVHRLLGITMQLHTLLGMKAGVHMHMHTTSFIGHNDAASYLVGYEGTSSYASICI